MKEKHKWGMTARKSSISYNTREKIVMMDGSRSTGRKIGFVVVFVDIRRRGALP